MSKEQSIFTVAAGIITDITNGEAAAEGTVSVIGDGFAEVDVNGHAAAAFTLVVNGVRYNVNVTEQRS